MYGRSVCRPRKLDVYVKLLGFGLFSTIKLTLSQTTLEQLSQRNSALIKNESNVSYKDTPVVRLARVGNAIRETRQLSELLLGVGEEHEAIFLKGGQHIEQRPVV